MSPAQDVCQIITELQPHQVVAGPLSGAHPIPLHIVKLPGPHDVLEGDLVGIRMTVCGALGQDVPDGH